MSGLGSTFRVRRAAARATSVLVAALTVVATGGWAAHAEDVLACAGVAGYFYQVAAGVDVPAECYATWLDETGSVFVPDSAWDLGEVIFGVVAPAVPTPETRDRMLELDARSHRPSCDGCLGLRAMRTKHKYAWEYVGYRTGNDAGELIDAMHVHAVLIHNTTSNDCATNAKYDGSPYFAQSNSAQYIRSLWLPDSPQKKGFNDRWTVAGDQRWRDDGGEWALGPEFDVCAQYS